MRVRDNWYRWRTSFQQREMRRKLCADALAHSHRVNMKRSWATWRRTLRLRVERSERLRSADGIRSSKLARQCFSIWLGRCSTRQLQGKKWDTAVRFDASCRLQKVIREWRRLVEAQDAKNAKKGGAQALPHTTITLLICMYLEKAAVLANRRLAQSALHVWRLKYQHKQVISQLEAVARLKYRQTTLRAALCMWLTRKDPFGLYDKYELHSCLV